MPIKQTVISLLTFVFRDSVFFATALVLLHTNTHAQETEALQKTQSGCSIFKNSSPAAIAIGNSSAVLTWSGECVNGLAQGPGVLRSVSKHGDPQKQSIYTEALTTKVHRGKPFGFMKLESKSHHPSIGEPIGPIDTKDTHWYFFWGDRSILINGLGLNGDDGLLAHAEDSAPIRSNDLKLYSSIGDGNGVLSLLKETCIGYPERFPECGWRAGGQAVDIYYFSYFKEGKKVYCPQPTELNSCADIANKVVEPYVLSAEAFIRQNMPYVRETEVAMQNTLIELGRQRELAVKRFEEKLDKAPVGELFSMADEFKSKGDTTRARSVLRKLMSRFPDHKLAELAASMLTDMQGR